MKISESQVINFLVVGSLCGYVLIASFSAIAGIESTPLSIALRASLVVAAFVLLFFMLRVRKVAPIGLIGLGFLFFWSIYFIRIIDATLVSRDPTLHEPSYYWIWGFGVCFLPFFSVSLARIRQNELFSLFMFVYAGYLFASFLAAIGGSGRAVNELFDLVETGRFRLHALNPISVGHLGASLLVLSVWFWLRKSAIATVRIRLIQCFGAALGFYLLMAANSRGPIVAFLVCISVVIAFSGRRRVISVVAVIVAALFLVVPFAKYLDEVHGISTYSRIFNTNQIQQSKDDGRMELYSNALNSFAEKPLTGSGLEEYKIGFYPHNVIIESFMATGVFGGVLFTVLLMSILVVGLHYYRQSADGGWAYLLAIQYMVGAQFSGALYSSGYFWVSIGLLLAVIRSKALAPIPNRLV